MAPECFKTTIDATTEVALQRAMFIKGFSKRGGEEGSIEWLDMELPVTPKGDGRLDLIGYHKKKQKFIICELKFATKNKINRPQKAANEVVKNYKCILENYQSFIDNHHYKLNDDGYKGKPFNWQDVIIRNNVELIIVANAWYWTYWIAHIGDSVPEIGVHDGFSFPVKCYSIDIQNDCFKKQKKQSGVGLYIPHIETDLIEFL